MITIQKGKRSLKKTSSFSVCVIMKPFKLPFISFCFLLSCTILQAQFTDVAVASGIDLKYQGTAPGAGVSFIDVNRDGWDDLTLADVDGIHYYENNGGSFTEVDLEIFFQGEVKQVLWADYDNDGDLDLYVTGYEAPNRLYQNIGNLEFVDSTQPAGLPINDKRHFGACFGDINRDGFLDLYYTERERPGAEEPHHNVFYLNNGDGTFREWTKTTRTADPGRLPFCAAFIDVNNDLWPDIYIANDRRRRNTLLVNMGNGTFADMSDESNSGISIDAMSVSPGDYDNDGWQDIYVSNIPEGNALLHNLGLRDEQDPLSVHFEEVAAETGTGFYDVGWGAQFLDGDNDGDWDLYVSGISIGTESTSSAYFENLGDGFFEELTEGFIGDTVMSFSNAVGDYNHDGIPEIAVMNHLPFSFQLWSNSTSGNFIEITLEGIASNKLGVGAFIEVFSSGHYQSKYTTSGSGFIGQNSQHHIFGLDSRESADSVLVRWPSGHVDKLTDLGAGERVTIVEGSTTGGVIDIDPAIASFRSTPYIEVKDAAKIDHAASHQDFAGGGAAFFDFDADGDDDLYITGGQDADHLYENKGDGTFIHVENTAAGIAIADTFYTTGVVTGDIDNDGYRDIFVMTRGSAHVEFARNLLFYNHGNGTFTEIWDQVSQGDLTFSMGATFLDFDLDGLLDLYVVNYIQEEKYLYNDDNEVIGYDHTCFANALYRNNGDLTFTKVENGLGTNDAGCGLAAVSTDYDSDGDPDLYIANDFGPWIEPNKLFRNESIPGEFLDVSEPTNCNIAMYGTGIAIGDFDNDLDPDYYITNFGKNVLLENQNGIFTDIADEAGVENTWAIQDSLMYAGWGTAFLDADNDMDLDLYVANGFLPAGAFLMSDTFSRDKLYFNLGEGTFQDLETASGIDNHFISRGMATSDFDQDGDVDILPVVLTDSITPGNFTPLFENTLEGQNWIEIRLEGTTINRDAFGSKAIVYASGIAQMRELTGGSSHCSQNSSILHFGLSDITNIDSIVVHWTGGHHIQKLYDIPANQILHVRQEGATSMENNLAAKPNSEMIVYPNPAAGDMIRVEMLNGRSPEKARLFSATGAETDVTFFPNGQNGALIKMGQKTAGGIYFLHVYTKEHFYIGKLIIR